MEDNWIDANEQLPQHPAEAKVTIYYLDESGKPKVWATWAGRPADFGSEEEQERRRRVDLTWVEFGIRVSTVFLMVDHNFGDSEKPVLWETMTFDDYVESRPRSEAGEGEPRWKWRRAADLNQVRYTSLGEAKAGHWAEVERVRSEVIDARVDYHRRACHYRGTRKLSA